MASVIAPRGYQDADGRYWIDRTETRTRVSLWRTPFGLHYEAKMPHDFADEEVAYRFDTIASGTIIGAHPELGAVVYRSDTPARTEATLPAERGQWIFNG